jgi:hypothetical protein
MTNTQQRFLVKDAKHSMALFISVLGISSYAASGFFIKWPDVIDAVLSGNDKNFLLDISILICLPMRAIAQSLSQMGESKMSLELIEDAMKSINENPHLAKAKLIAICNQEIISLGQKGAKLNLDVIRGVDDD